MENFFARNLTEVPEGAKQLAFSIRALMTTGVHSADLDCVLVSSAGRDSLRLFGPNQAGIYLPDKQSRIGTLAKGQLNSLHRATKQTASAHHFSDRERTLLLSADRWTERKQYEIGSKCDECSRSVGYEGVFSILEARDQSWTSMGLFT